MTSANLGTWDYLIISRFVMPLSSMSGSTPGQVVGFGGIIGFCDWIKVALASSCLLSQYGMFMEVEP